MLAAIEEYVAALAVDRDGPVDKTLAVHNVCLVTLQSCHSKLLPLPGAGAALDFFTRTFLTRVALD